jgi:hypothetical protein
VSKPKAARGKKRRKPYMPPTLTKLSPVEAKRILEANAIPGDKQAKKLLEEINRHLPSKPN